MKFYTACLFQITLSGCTGTQKVCVWERVIQLPIQRLINKAPPVLGMGPGPEFRALSTSQHWGGHLGLLSQPWNPTQECVHVTNSRPFSLLLTPLSHTNTHTHTHTSVKGPGTQQPVNHSVADPMATQVPFVGQYLAASIPPTTCLGPSAPSFASATNGIALVHNLACAYQGGVQFWTEPSSWSHYCPLPLIPTNTDNPASPLAKSTSPANRPQWLSVRVWETLMSHCKHSDSPLMK